MYFNRLLFFQILFSFLRGIFVLLNRKNNPTMAGLISGAEHSGKTFQCKREIFNALAGSDDTVFVVTADDSYDGFVKELGGIVAEFPKTNPFEMATHYGLSEPDAYSKSVMLEALFSSMVEKKKDSINFTDNEKLILKDGDDEADTIEKEIQILCESCSEFNVPEDILSFIRERKVQLPFVSSKIKNLSVEIPSPVPNTRLILYKVKNNTQAVLLLDYLWNRQIDLKKENRSAWLFVDPVDFLFDTDQEAAFLIDYAKKMNAMENVLTTVVQSSVKIFTDSSSYRYEDYLQVLGYFKLLSHGPIERKKYMNLLNIPGTLLNYMASGELGKGVILTQSSNYSFDDNLGLEEGYNGSDFYDLFKDDKENSL